MLGFQHPKEAERFLEQLRKRLADYGLELHSDKTRLIQFGRFAAADRDGKGRGTGNVPLSGIPHICGTIHESGKFTVHRKTVGKWMTAKLMSIGGAAQPHASADCGNRGLAATGRPWVLPLPCGSGESAAARSVPAANRATLAIHFAAAQSAQPDVGANGVLAWRTGLNVDRQLAWFDRSGKQPAGLDSREPYLSPRLSPDGGWIALIRRETPVVSRGAMPSESSLTRNIWLMGLSRRSVTPLTLGASESPVWSPDGRRIVFGRRERPTFGLYLKPVSGAADEELLLRTADRSTPLSWSPDGRFILFQESQRETKSDLFVLPLVGERKPTLVARHADYGEFSPDGRWIAYAEGQSGRFEIWVQSFAESGTRLTPKKWQVSVNGGVIPRWRSDSRELFYYEVRSRTMMSVSVRTGATFKANASVALFNPRDEDPTDFEYDVSADGQRFLISRLAQDDSRPVNVSLDWLAVAKK